VDIVQDLAVARIGLRQFLHMVDELTGHSWSGRDRPAFALGAWRRCLEFAVDVASG
jgi:hypothetical protein